MSAVFLHGAGSSQHTWTFQFNQFSHLLPCLFLDLPGHGQSGGETLDTIAAYADLMAEFLTAVQVTKPIVIGHSMGTAILLQYALISPAFAGMVLIGGGARLRVASAIIDLIRTDLAKAVELIAHNLFCESRLDLFFRQMKSDMLRCGQTGLLNDFQACDNFDLMPDLDKIQQSTLAIVGSRDTMTPPKYTHYLAGHMPRCRAHIIDQAGHMVMAEKPAECNAVVHDFIQTCIEEGSSN